MKEWLCIRSELYMYINIYKLKSFVKIEPMCFGMHAMIAESSFFHLEIRERQAIYL